VLDLVDQGTDVGKQLDGEVVASLNELLGVLRSTDAGGSAGQDNSTRAQSSALGKEGNELGNVKDQVTITSWLASTHYMCGINRD